MEFLEEKGRIYAVDANGDKNSLVNAVRLVAH